MLLASWLLWGSLYIAALGQPDDTAPFAPAYPREVVCDPYMPGSGRTAPPRTVQFGSHVSVQVNVDADGNNILGDAANEPSIAVDPVDPKRMAIVWRQFDSVQSDFRQAGYAYSTDGGRHWTFPGVLEPGVPRSDPVLAVGPNGEFYWYSIRFEKFSGRVFRSLDQGQTWSFLADAFGGDKPWLAVDRTNGIGHGNLYVASSGYDFLRGTDGGVNWTNPWLPNTPYFGTVEVDSEGAVWIAGFPSPGGGSTILVKSLDAQNPDSIPTFPIRANVPLGGYAAASRPPNPVGLLGQPWIAVDPSNSAHTGFAYYICSVQPTNSSFTRRTDVKFSRSINGGVTWSPGIQINSDPSVDYVHHWFATMSVSPNGRIDIIWNDTRHSPTNRYISELFYSSSSDGGTIWTPNEQLSPAWDSSVGWPVHQMKIGDYYHMISDNVGANLAWAATFNGEQDVWFLRIGDELCQGLIAEQPASPLVCANSAVSLRTSAVQQGALSFQWRKDGRILADTGTMFGTQDATLVFIHAQPSDAGYYECLVKLDGCGAEMTKTAKLTVFATGTADGNQDGYVNGLDISAFVSALVDRAPVSAALCAFELTGDGVVDMQDLGPFVTLLLNL